MKEYTIISGYQVADVIRMVNERLSDGWELYGNLAIGATPDRDGDLYAQALIKKVRGNNEPEPEGSFGIRTS